MKFLVKKILDYIANKNNRNNRDLNELTTYIVKSYTDKFKDLKKDNIQQIVRMLRDLKGTSLIESLKILKALNDTINLNGDICEFGVAQGKTSKLMAYMIKNSKKKIYLYDSFQGLPKASKKDILKDDIFNLGKIENYEGKMSHAETKVITELKSIKIDFEKVIINKGYFNEENLQKFKFPELVSFAYIDFDYYQPTLDVLNVLEDKLSVGSVIIVDDYDFFSTGVKTAVDEWFEVNKIYFEIKILKTQNASFAIIKKIK